MSMHRHTANSKKRVITNISLSIDMNNTIFYWLQSHLPISDFIIWLICTEYTFKYKFHITPSRRSGIQSNENIHSSKVIFCHLSQNLDVSFSFFFFFQIKKCCYKTHPSGTFHQPDGMNNFISFTVHLW